MCIENAIPAAGVVIKLSMKNVCQILVSSHLTLADILIGQCVFTRSLTETEVPDYQMAHVVALAT